MTGPDQQTRPAPPGRPRPAADASMDLLNQIIRQPIDPDYARVAAEGAPTRARVRIGVVAVIIGALFAIAAVQTNRTAPALETERTELISRVQAAETESDELREQVTTLSDEIARLRTSALGNDGTAQQLEARIGALAPAVGDVPVTGPGVVVVVDDAPATEGTESDRVLDLDLQILANGLWEAGAEAVAINGHRLSTLTAIRSAGDAITVDYRSLTRPYRVEAIGDPRTLPARFAETSAGSWWTELSRSRRMGFSMSDDKTLELAADPGITLRHARPAS